MTHASEKLTTLSLSWQLTGPGFLTSLTAAKGLQRLNMHDEPRLTAAAQLASVIKADLLPALEHIGLNTRQSVTAIPGWSARDTDALATLCEDADIHFFAGTLLDRSDADWVGGGGDAGF